jgi:putative Mn2+ efflux pump MntP
MRALCGAIIAAGALIGLGLTAIAEGMRYSAFPYYEDPEHKTIQYVGLWHMDTSLMLAFAVTTITLVIGLAVAFLGLAYHHHRRHHEMLHRAGAAGATETRITA